MRSKIPVSAIAIIVAITTIFSANQASAASPFKTKFDRNNAVLKMKWEGKIAAPMARTIENAIYANHDRAVGGFALYLNSRGGNLREAIRVIKILRQLKQRRSFNTFVTNGRVCGSACIPIFLQGERRTMGLASLWLFHEVSKKDKRTKKIYLLQPQRTNKLFQRFFVPAGVSRSWINNLLPKIRKTNYWMTGTQLFNQNSGIGTNSIPARQIRKVYPRRQ